MQHIIINLQAPLMYFGGENIDNHSFTREFPGQSMLTGLLANALGWDRLDHAEHHDLQARLVYAARIDQEPATSRPLVDFQTARLGPGIDPFRTKNDRNWVVGWTTRGTPDFRTGGEATYNSPWLLFRHYVCDAHVTVALRLDPPHGPPTIDQLAESLQEPARPLFIGKKSCLPSTRIFAGFQDAPTALEALMAQPLLNTKQPRRAVRCLWQDEETPPAVQPARRHIITDTINWESRLHGGGRMVCEAAIPAELFAESQPASPVPQVS